MRSVPPTLRPVTARQPLGSIASAGTKYWPPALLTSTSRRPWRSRHVADDPLGVLVAADVAGDGRSRARPIRSQASASTSSRRPGEHDVRAAGGELGRGGAAEVGAAARDEHHAAIEQAGAEDRRRYGR